MVKGQGAQTTRATSLISSVLLAGPSAVVEHWCMSLSGPGRPGVRPASIFCTAVSGAMPRGVSSVMPHQCR